jgi:hypothetical protein
MWIGTHALSKILVQRSLAFSFSYIRETPPHPLPPLRRPPRAVDAAASSPASPTVVAAVAILPVIVAAMILGNIKKQD